jgi:hypothetical protein
MSERAGEPQKRYYDFNIRNYPQFVEKLRYLHRNPVKAGLCERPEDWEWSSNNSNLYYATNEGFGVSGVWFVQYSSSRSALAERERRLPAFRDGGGQRPWTPLYLEREYEHDRGLQHVDLAAGGNDSVRARRGCGPGCVERTLPSTAIRAGSVRVLPPPIDSKFAQIQLEQGRAIHLSKV